jgi:alpha-ribazole phosphatase
MKTTTIDLLRHGDVAGGVRLLGQWDEPLSELGWSQMRVLVNSKRPP